MRGKDAFSKVVPSHGGAESHTDRKSLPGNPLNSKITQRSSETLKA